VGQLSGCPIYVVDRTAFPVDKDHPEAPTMDTVTGALVDGRERLNWGVAFIDYLTKVGPFGTDELARVPCLTNWVFDLCRRTGLHLVCLMQSNKAAYSRKDGRTKERTVGLEDVRGTIETVADFDNCIGLTRTDWNTEEPLDPAPSKLVINKARQGPGGKVDLSFHKKIGRFDTRDTAELPRGRAARSEQHVAEQEE
jgi:hypothetical protein